MSEDMEAVFTAAMERARKARSSPLDRPEGTNGMPEARVNLDKIRRVTAQVISSEKDRLIGEFFEEGGRLHNRLQEYERKANETASRASTKAEREHQRYAAILAEQIDNKLDEIKREMVRTIKIEMPEVPAVEIEEAHEKVPRVLRKVAIRQHVVMVGPAGSGKGFASRQIAESLGLPYYSKSCSIMDTKSDWLGFIDAGGTYHPTPFRQAFEGGGEMFIDEMDAANPSVFVLINTALSDGVMAFPDGMIRAHPDFVVVAAANTWGRGADRQYRGRAVQDAASLNRFAKVWWDYDEDLERRIAPHQPWCQYVQAVRKIVFDHQMKYVVSPRQTLGGGREILAGAPVPEVAYDHVLADWSRDDIEKITSILDREARGDALEIHKEVRAA